MNYYVFVTGCQQNYYDSEKITHLVEKMGYLKSEEYNADLIIAVACSVRQKAVDRIFGKFKVWNKLKNKPKIIIIGCVLPKDKIKFKSKVLAILDSKNIETKLPKLINCRTNKLLNNSKIISKQCNNFVPIMYGCNNFCSYCAVPYTRGREISIKQKEIIKEIKYKISCGIDNIVLLGQNVNSYKPGFVKLLKNIETINGLEKISFMTSHPKDMSRDLINWMANSSKFSSELHLPVQSGDDEILKKMNRHYSAESYLKLALFIKTSVKLNYFSTDIIVGFPGETRDQFKNTYNLCKTINFDKAFISQYSPRAGTSAAKLKDNVSPEEKKARWIALDDLINKKKG